jgi:hypothetical protein
MCVLHAVNNFIFCKSSDVDLSFQTACMRNISTCGYPVVLKWSYEAINLFFSCYFNKATVGRQNAAIRFLLLNRSCLDQ